MRVNASRVYRFESRASWLLKRHVYGAAIVAGLVASVGATVGTVAYGVSRDVCGAAGFLVGYCVAGVVAATIC